MLICMGLVLLFVSVLTVSERKMATFKFTDNSEYIVVGHSHPECAFNDTIISNFKNLAASGESYYYTYNKIKNVIKDNPSIRVVFIEFTNNQINLNMNQWIWGDKYMSHRYPTYSSFMDLEDNLLLLANNPSGYLNSVSVSIKKKLGRILDNDLDFTNKIGGYLYLNRNKTDSLIKQAKFEAETKATVVSVHSLIYLDKIIDYCANNDKRVILIRSPLHISYKGYLNESIYKDILNTRYANIEYIDFSDSHLLDSQFGDLEHLNFKGATIFSKKINFLLKNGLLNKLHKQKFVDSVFTKKIKI